MNSMKDSAKRLAGMGEVSRREFVGLMGAASLAAAGAAGIASGPGMANVAFADGGDTVIVTQTGDPASWCPDVLADDNAWPIVQNMFNRLAKLDVNSQVVPDAAESWETSDDALAITYHLRQDLVWSDGEPLTAQDAVYTFQYIKDHPECYVSANLQNVASFEAPDDYTFVINLNAPDMSLVGTLAWYACFIMPKHIYDVEGVLWENNDAAQLVNTPVTSGPYKLSEYVPGQSISLVANENYWHVPAIPNLIYSIITDDSTAVQALQNGETDLLKKVPSAYIDSVLADPNIRMVLQQDPSPYRIIFNLNRTERHLDDVNVRRAIAMCIDREAICEKALGGVSVPEVAFYPTIAGEYSNQEDVAPAYDPEGARKLLEDSGYVADENGYFITGFTIDAFSGTEYEQVSRLLASNMDAIGLQCEVNMSEMNAWSDKVSVQRDFDIELQAGFMGPDAYAMMSRLGTDFASNYGFYSNPDFDDLCNQANATGDDAERADLYRQAQAILAEDLPYLPLATWSIYYAYAAGLVNTGSDGAGQWGKEEWTFAEWSA